eukprot:ctg_1891.g637
MVGLHERSKLFQTLYAAGSLAAMALFLRWVLYGSAPEYSRFRNFKPRPQEERNLRPLLAGPAEGFYWPPNMREANIEELLERRMQLSREMWQREGRSVTAEDLIRNGGKAAAAKQGTGGRGTTPRAARSGGEGTGASVVKVSAKRDEQPRGIFFSEGRVQTADVVFVGVHARHRTLAVRPQMPLQAVMAKHVAASGASCRMTTVFAFAEQAPVARHVQAHFRR